jgi:hypothetical protein
MTVRNVLRQHAACHYYSLFVIHLLFISYLVSAAAACVKHPAGHAIIIVYILMYLFSI